ncbi:MAG: hypothetical protein ACJAUP_002583 [Cellvibrionaceae bacterium]|jgi:hypothetical protein
MMNKMSFNLMENFKLLLMGRAIDEVGINTYNGAHFESGLFGVHQL